jgi:hypothetical protein
MTENFFTRLNLDFSDTKLDDLVLTFGKSYRNDTQEEILIVHWTEDWFADHIKSKLPESFRSWIRSVRITVVSDSPPPHRDHGGFVCINYYLETDNTATTFWTAQSEAVASVAYGQTTANVYQIEDLIEEGQFVAEPDSCYLLNIGEVHTVDIKKDSIRKMIQLTFDPEVTYNMVLDKCKELNLVKDIK